MKKNRFAEIACFIFLEAMLLFLCVPDKVQASSADIAISSDKTEYSKGDIINIYIDIEAEVLPGEFEGYLLYPSDILEYTAGNDIITGGEGILKISDKIVSPTRTSRRYSLRFRATGTGECEFKFSDTPSLYEFEDGYLMSVSITELKVNISSSKDASGDTSLAILKISPGKLEPEFSPSVKEYRTKVPFSTEKLIVSAAASDQNAEIEVSGNTKLEYGNNRVEITVKAENGDTSRYVIICEREGTSDNSDVSEITSQPSDDLNGSGNGAADGNKGDSDKTTVSFGEPFGIKAENNGQDIMLYLGKKYNVTDAEGLAEDERQLLNDYKKTSLVIDGVSIPVYTSDFSGDYMLVVLKNEFGEIGLYSYDRTEKTLQRYRKKSEEKKSNVMTESIEALELANSYEKSLSTLTLIIAVLCGLTMALLIVVIRLSIKSRNDGIDD